jgi:hypothetical protein
MTSSPICQRDLPEGKGLSLKALSCQSTKRHLMIISDGVNLGKIGMEGNILCLRVS